MELSTKAIYQTLQKITYPGEEKDIVATGMVQQIKIDGNKVSFTLTFKTDLDPHIATIQKQCIDFLEQEFHGIDVRNNITIRVLKKERPVTGLDKVKNIVGVASGKGGVGKSTIAVNLAVGLSKLGYKVGLLDADIYGPSLVHMMGLDGVVPGIRQENGKDVLIPVEKYGLKLMSIGFFVQPEQPLVWRGPMATSALKQIMLDPDWGVLDYLIIDMPPGTGDIHLTLVQSAPITGVLIVSTPQQVALADVVKGINMFRSQSINVPIIGLVENMAWFTPTELPNNRYYIFGRDKLQKIANDYQIPVVGQIPIVESIAADSDNGTPPAIKSDIVGQQFMELASNTHQLVEKRNKEFPPTKIVAINNT